MKISGKAIWLSAAALMVFAACETEEGVNLRDNAIEGVYTGTLTKTGTRSADGIAESTVEGTAEVTITGNNEVQVNCYTIDFDTTFVMNYYQHHDSVYVCSAGNDFEGMYDHMTGGHMTGGMMGGYHNGETQWMNHMNEVHQQDDDHFGGFDMNHHTFSYTFKMTDGEGPYELHFKGRK